MIHKMKLNTLFLYGCLSSLYLASSAFGAAPAELSDGRNVYDVRYMENPPYGASAWSQSDFIKKNKGADRFMAYNSDAARGLILDATATRQFEKSDAAAARNTTFHMVYNHAGIYLYVEAEEPEIRNLLDSILDPKSPGHSEGYEIFFVPGLYEAPYYQVFTYLLGKTHFYDWGIPHRDYRSLESYTKVESLPIENGVATFLFIPWEAWYERVPLNGDLWRFSIIRWMPYGKAGGVTWGGQVHDTGNFGLLRFEKPTAEQKLKIETRILRTAWFKFLAESNTLTNFWNDAEVGDQAYYERALLPLIETYKAQGESLGNPDAWNAETVEQGKPFLKNWMEFRYIAGALRTQYLTRQMLVRGQ